MGHASHCGGAEPRHTKNCTESPHADQKQQVEVKPRTFGHFPLRFADDQAAQGDGKESKRGYIPFSPHIKETHVVI